MSAADLSTAQARADFAEETLKLVPALEAAALPWRFLTWLRIYREVRRRNALVLAAMGGS